MLWQVEYTGTLAVSEPYGFPQHTRHRLIPCVHQKNPVSPVRVLLSRRLPERSNPAKTRSHMSRLLSILAAFVLAISSFSAMAAPRLFAVNPFANGVAQSMGVAPAAVAPGDYGFYEYNPANAAVVASRIITVPGRTITGTTALALDPTSGIAYAVVKATGVSGRLLITINLDTAVGVEIGNLGDSFSSLAFRGDGQMFGVTGDGSTVPETLYLINKANASKTLAATLGNGADGEVIAFNPVDGAFYHWSGGSGGVFFERILATAPYTVTTISSNVTGVGEVFGAVWDSTRGAFLVSDISSNLQVQSTAGVIGATLGTFPQDVRGLILINAVAAPVIDVPTLASPALVALLVALALVGVGLSRRRKV